MRFLRFILLSFSICTCAAFVLEQPVFAQDEEEIEDEEEEYIEEEDTEEEYSEEEIEEEVEEEVVEPEEDNEEELAEEEEEPEEAVEDIEDDEEGEESGEQVEEEEEVEASPIKATLKEDEKAFESPVNVEERTELYNSAREFETKIETALDEMDKHIETFDGIHQKLDEKLDAFHIQVSDSIGALQNIADRLKLYLNKKEGVFSVRPISKKDDQVKMLNALLEELKVAVELYEKDVEKLRSKMELVATKEADIINLLQNANEKRNDARKKTVEAGIAKRNILKSGMDGKAEVSKIKVIEKHISEIKGVLETDISQKINSLGDEVGDQINEIESENIKLKEKAGELEKKVKELGDKEAEIVREDERLVTEKIRKDLDVTKGDKVGENMEEKVKREPLWPRIVEKTKSAGGHAKKFMQDIWSFLKMKREEKPVLENEEKNNEAIEEVEKNEPENVEVPEESKVQEKEIEETPAEIEELEEEETEDEEVSEEPAEEEEEE